MKLKRLLACTLVLLLVVSLLPIGAMAEDVEDNPAGSTTDISESQTMNWNRGEVGKNEGVINNNGGSVIDNVNIIDRNVTGSSTGTVGQKDETGKVVAGTGNNGTIRVNDGGVIYMNNETGIVENNYIGTIEINNGTVGLKDETGKVYINSGNCGVIETNNGTVFANWLGGEVGKLDETGKVVAGTGNNGTIEENYGTVIANNKDGTIETNEGRVGVWDENGKPVVKEGTGNFGTVNTNNGTITTNEKTVGTNGETGVVLVNNGDIETNEGTVTSNSGEITANEGSVRKNEKTGTIGTNNNFVMFNTGTIGTNNSEVEQNNGTIGTNNNDVGCNDGTIGTNNNEVEWNYQIITTNNGCVSGNNGKVETNAIDGVVENHSKGTVDSNFGTVVEYTNGETNYYGLSLGKNTKNLTLIDGKVEDGTEKDLDEIAKSIKRSGYKMKGYTAYYREDGENVEIDDTSNYLMNAPTWLKILWEKIAGSSEPQSLKTTATVYTSLSAEQVRVGALVRCGNLIFKIIEVNDDSIRVATVGKLSDEALADMLGFLKQYLSDAQIAKFMGESELLEQELVAKFFGGSNEHIAFYASRDLFA